jgi:carboxyl-terminal processing protease
MLREGEAVKFSIVRARIDVPNIDFRRLDNSAIGYIRLFQFTDEARDEIDDALSDLDTASLNGLILDFRGNPGGLLSSAIDVASAFIEDGDLLIEDFGNDNEQVYTTNGSFNDIDLPLVILVDERSASASELVAGAMQDSGTATIIGEITFGKGTVQNIRPLTNGGGLRLTIARWLTPNGHWIHGTGIVPDIIVDWESETLDVPDDPQLQAAIEFLNKLVPVSVQQASTQ